MLSVCEDIHLRADEGRCLKLSYRIVLDREQSQTPHSQVGKEIISSTGKTKAKSSATTVWGDSEKTVYDADQHNLKADRPNVPG